VTAADCVGSSEDGGRFSDGPLYRLLPSQVLQASSNKQAGRTTNQVRGAGSGGDACRRHGVDEELTRGEAEGVQMIGLVPANAINWGLRECGAVPGYGIRAIEVEHLQPRRSRVSWAAIAARVVSGTGDRQQLS